jgi:ABC-type lipoprotein release transport system permease subunit
VVLLGVAALMVAIALAASAGPAWRAARVDPAVALREE